MVNETKKILLDNGLKDNSINILDVDKNISIKKKIDFIYFT